MTHPYVSETAVRTNYLERSKSNLKDALNQSDARLALGSSAIRLLALAEGLYVPEVSQEGLVTLSGEQVRSDNVPMLALRDGEQVMRDHTFATFAPHQYETAAPASRARFSFITSRVISGSEGSFIAQTFEQEVAVMRMVRGVSRHPTPSEFTYFNLRPFILVRYDPAAELVDASTMVSTLVMADTIMENPVTVVPSQEAFDALNAAWDVAAEKTGDVIERLNL